MGKGCHSRSRKGSLGNQEESGEGCLHDTAGSSVVRQVYHGLFTLLTQILCSFSVIAALPTILEPIFDLLAEYTGWRFSGIAGGPEPADGGRLNMIMYVQYYLFKIYLQLIMSP